MKRVCFFSMVVFLSLNLMGQNDEYEQYYRHINEHLAKGKCESAQRLYNAYKEDSGKSDQEMERRIAACLDSSKNTLSGSKDKTITVGSSLPTFEFDGEIYMVAPDPGEPMTYKMAVSYCANLYFEGYSDWILPSEEQYNFMYFKRTIIGGFVPEYYWTKSQHDCGCNVYVNTYFSFIDASIDYECSLKRNSYKFRVRPIRKVNE